MLNLSSCPLVLISQGEPKHPSEEAQSHALYTQSHCFGHGPVCGPGGDTNIFYPINQRLRVHPPALTPNPMKAEAETSNSLHLNGSSPEL